MKKLFIILSMFTLIVSQSWGQLRFGFQAGVNFSKLTAKYQDLSSSTLIKAGFNAGAIMEASFGKSFAIQPGVLFSMKGGRDGSGSSKSTTNLNYIEVPINAMYKLNISSVKIIFLVGPYFGYAAIGKYKDESGSSSIEFGSESGQKKPIDYGLNFGAGVEFGRFQVKAQYGLGLGNIGNESGVTLKNYVIGLNAVYFFHGK